MEAMEATASLSELASRIDSALQSDVERPWCVHRLYEELLLSIAPESSRDDLLLLTQRSADELVALGLARREYVSAISIGVHCEDSLYWSSQSQKLRLADFGPDYEWPTVLQRLGSHFRCHGL
jgi:hypothetical protein